ncbi:hypothetical protein MKW98_026081 [Papaver atlanticum]|uniref:Uncharacterized protein n=1 Tax=Papaver atlanticum TaxID=357466 RepID=A0AAD4RZE7_9MAGN|nr:hypothetical protein MKW98_026081 [Papaver atlanticum]
MRPHVMEARIARLREHRKDADKLMKELGVLTTVHLSGEDADLSDMDPEELDQLARDHISVRKLFVSTLVSEHNSNSTLPSNDMIIQQQLLHNLYK